MGALYNYNISKNRFSLSINLKLLLFLMCVTLNRMYPKRIPNNIEIDSFDRERFEELEANSEELKEVIKKGSNLLPNFRSFLLDLFAGFYKYNVIFLPEDKVKRSALINRKLLEKAFSSEVYNNLREETILDEFKAAIATVTLAGEVVRWIKSEEGLSERSLIKEWELEKSEQEYEEFAEEMEMWKELEDKEAIGKSFEYVKKKVKFEIRKKEEELKELEEEHKDILERADMKLQNLIRSALEKAHQRAEESERELMQWATSMGVPQERTVGEKLDLAAKLFKSEKLRKLAMMVGSLKEEMFSTRRKVWAKRGSEVYDISIGDDLGRVIPTELVFLRHKVLRKDFFKRFVEEKLLQYYLREEKGRGPIVVCVDGSSSMDGNKEIWSKAVCLTILEIARRQRRKFSVIVFSSKGSPLRVFNSDLREGWGMKEGDILELADYFPGGGTDFEDPLNKAVELLQMSKFKNGDIVFITDGECDVSDSWLSEFLDKKKELSFKVFSILIDLTGRESVESLRKLSDKVTAISRLTSKDARDIFIALD